MRIESFATLDSTQALLRRRLEAGDAVHGLVVRAVEQTAGRGRRGRAYEALPGGSYQSLAVAGAGLEGAWAGPAVALEVGIGVAEALQRFGAQVRLKWPNDLLYLGRKVGGILCEVVEGYLLIGVGVNVHNPVPLGATALRGWDVDSVHAAVLEGVQCALEAVRSAGGLAERYAPLDGLWGCRVVVEVADGVRLEGLAEGVDRSGRLLLRGPAGLVGVAHGSVERWGCAGK